MPTSLQSSMGTPESLRERIKGTFAECVAGLREDAEWKDSTVERFMAEHKYATAILEDVFYEVVCDALGLPQDPWPELTAETLRKMLNGPARRSEAKRRGILIPSDDYKLWLVDKWAASRNRQWLEFTPTPDGEHSVQG